MCGELWQADALHGPMLMNPATGRIQRAIIFGLIDDRSRLIPYVEAGFGETEQRFLTVLYNAIARRGIVRRLLLDNRVTTLDELNLRLWTWVETEYHHQPHSSLSGRTPLEVWESDASQIRWVSDHSQLEQAFYGEAERFARNDSTIPWRGVCYEVPPHLRRQKVRLRYALLDSTRVSLIDAGVEVPLRRVDPVANAHRSRAVSPPAPTPGVTPHRTGLNAAELILARAAGLPVDGGGHSDE